MKRVDGAAGDVLEQGGRALAVRVPQVDVRPVGQEHVDDLEMAKVIFADLSSGSTKSPFPFNNIGSSKSLTQSGQGSHLELVVVGLRGGVERRAVGLVGGVDLAAALDEQLGDLQRREEVVLTVLEEVLQRLALFTSGRTGFDLRNC